MQFSILGPLEVRSDQGDHLLVRQPRYRAVLCILLLHADKLVPRRELSGVLWGSQAPSDPAGALRTCMYSLRKALEAPDRLQTRQGGYGVKLRDRDTLDLRHFNQLMTSGLRAAECGDHTTAARFLQQALDLWRQPPLADFPDGAVRHGPISALLEQYARAQEALVDTRLALGQHRDLIAPLRELTAAAPLRERSWEQLILALYRSGNQAGALDAYSRARSVLAQECGIDPGRDLQDLQRRVLAADPALNPSRSGDVGPVRVVGRPKAAKLAILGRAEAMPAEDAAESSVPWELPGAVSHFTGRRDELADLTSQLRHAETDVPESMVISAICGPAGAGKTALALQWAHMVAADHFPDGQLYVNLRGYDPGQPLTPGAALAGILRSLGVGGRDIPAEDDERAARYRSLLSRRQVLIVLDNARDAEQVRPLLPGTPSCLTLVTSRDTLAGLVARDGALRVDLDRLPPNDAIDLLVGLIGQRAVADPHAVEQLATQCCRLPLALRVFAELALARPAVPLCELAAELNDQRQRLDLFEAAGDRHTGLRAVFSWSYQQLDEAAARGFRLLGLHPGPCLDRYVCAALTGDTAAAADHMLETLARRYLVQPIGPGRYVMHDLLRDYARELATMYDSPDRRQAALTRLLDYYLYSATAAARILYPAEQHHRPHVPVPHTPVPAFGDADAAAAWLDAELANLVTLSEHANENGWPNHAVGFSLTLFRYLNVRDRLSEAAAIHGHARDAATRTGNASALATALANLAAVEFRWGHNKAAADLYGKAVTLHHEADNVPGEAGARHNVGLVDLHCGRYRQATPHIEQALALFRAAGDRFGEAYALTNLGMVNIRQGNYAKASDYEQQAVALCRELGDRFGEAYALTNLGMVELRQGDCRQASSHLGQAVELCRETGFQPGEAYALSTLAMTDLEQGTFHDALHHAQQALAVSRDVCDRRREAEALNGLGEVYLAISRPDRALIQHQAALQLATPIDDVYEQARAQAGLGNAYHVLGQSSHARCRWREALTGYAGLGVPEARHIRERLGDGGDSAELGTHALLTLKPRERS